jgi:HlyD family secretion protein
MFDLRRKRLVIAGSAALGLGLIGSVVIRGQRHGTVQYFAQAVTRGDIRNVVTATGTVQAVVTVDVGSQVSGKIQTIYADYNSKVKRGQVLARIDPRPFEAQLSNASADLAAARAHVRTMQADVVNQQASVKAAQANVEDELAARRVADVTLQRDTTLLQRGLLARSDFDTAKAADDEAVAKHNQAVAALEQAHAQATSSAADLAQAEAQVDQAKATVETSRLNLSYATISSPVDGVVVSRSVDVGQTVAASLQAPLLFVIANDLTKMQVNANVDEADVGHLSDREPVSFFVDAYPHDTFTGRISEIRLNPQTVQNVVTYSVIIDVDNPQLKLRPGMTANVTVTIEHRSNALKLPNAALRYQPAGVTRAQVAAMLGARGGEGRGGWREALGAGRRPEAAVDGRASVPSGTEPGGGRPADAVATSGSVTVAGSPDHSRSLPVADAPLAPGQRWNPADKIRFPAEDLAGDRPAIVWVLDAQGRPAARKVTLGVTDGVSTELVSGDVHASDRLVIADTSESPALGASRPGGPSRGMFRF